MNIVYVVLPASIVLAVIAVLLFIWAARRGQFDDLETPGMRMLHDDEPIRGRATKLEPESESDDAGSDAAEDEGK
jgi:cbb3-type cytochrome oxidase maturation protein